MKQGKEDIINMINIMFEEVNYNPKENDEIMMNCLQDIYARLDKLEKGENK